MVRHRNEKYVAPEIGKARDATLKAKKKLRDAEGRMSLNELADKRPEPYTPGHWWLFPMLTADFLVRQLLAELH